jgi:hypothetical protein
MEYILGLTVPTVGIFSLYKRKSSELWLVHNPEPHVEGYMSN